MSFSAARLAAGVRSCLDNSAAPYEKAVPRRLKPVRFARLYGTAEPVPFRSLIPFAFLTGLALSVLLVGKNSIWTGLTLSRPFGTLVIFSAARKEDVSAA
jgi:hypothetical protein